MANHLRRQIREAVATAVTGLTTTGARVFQSRVYPLERTDLPGLLIYTADETVEPSTIHEPAIIERTLRLRIVGVAKAVDDLDDVLDQIVKEVEIAIAGMSLTSLAEYVALSDIAEPEYAREVERPTGRVTMTFEAKYFTAANAPDVAL